LAANAIGLIAYLHLASKTWIEPELRGVPHAIAGTTFVWVLSAFPVLFVFLLVDIAWLCVTISRGFRSRDWWPTTVVMGTAAIWTAAVLLDFSNH
jgi:hypothetical protein